MIKKYLKISYSSHCFFQFVQAIVNKMKIIKIIKSLITKYWFEIIKNIDLIYFIRPTCVKTFIEFLKFKFKDEKEKLYFNT